MEAGSTAKSWTLIDRQRIQIKDFFVCGEGAGWVGTGQGYRV